MYQFTIKKQEDGGFKFELDGIKLLVNDYTVKDEKHFMGTPGKAIAWFNIADNLYGVSNEPTKFATVEAFYDVIKNQYMMLAGAGTTESVYTGLPINPATLNSNYTNKRTA